MKAASIALVMAVLSSYELEARARGCSERSDIYGYRHCRPFGGGYTVEGTSPFVFELQLSQAFLDTDHRAVHEAFVRRPKAGGIDYAPGSLGRSISDWTIGFGVSGYFTPWLYVGARLSFGGGINPLPATRHTDFDTLRATGPGFAGEEALMVGLRLPLGYVSLRSEGSLVGHTDSLSQPVVLTNGRRLQADGLFEYLLLEQRFYLDIWARPWMTVSAWGGFQALDIRDRFAGISTGFHFRNYDGKFLF